MRHTVAMMAIMLGASLASADTIRFKSGKVMECDVLKYDKGELTIRDKSGKVIKGKMSGVLTIAFSVREDQEPEKTTAPPMQPSRGGGRPPGGKTGSAALADSDWTVTHAEDVGKRLASSNQFVESKATTGRFIRIRFKVKNKTNKEARIMDTPRVIDSQGREFREIDQATFYLPAGAKGMALEAIPATMEREFWAIYEVAADSNGLKFQARSLAMFGKKALIDLGL